MCSWRDVLDLLHIPHQGQIKMYLGATSHYYWPQLKQDVIMTVESCPICRELSNYQPAGPPVAEDIIQRILKPFKQLALNQFTINRI